MRWKVAPQPHLGDQRFEHTRHGTKTNVASKVLWSMTYPFLLQITSEIDVARFFNDLIAIAWGKTMFPALANVIQHGPCIVDETVKQTRGTRPNGPSLSNTAESVD
jgi:hypothetical protein